MKDKSLDAQKLINDINQGVFYFNEKEYPQLANNILEIMNIFRQQNQYHMDEAEGILKAVLIKIARK